MYVYIYICIYIYVYYIYTHTHTHMRAHTHRYIYYLYIHIWWEHYVGSASDGSSAKRNAIFIKMSKANHIKILIFRKHFSRSLINVRFNMFLFWHFHLFLLFAHFSTKKSVPKTLF